MNLLVQMAWRNVWRNKRRALLLFCAMTAGLVGVLFTMGFARGYLRQMEDQAVLAYEGHLKLLAPGYNENPIVENNMAPLGDLHAAWDRDPFLAAWCERVVAPGLLSTPRQSRVVTLLGVDPAREAAVSMVARTIAEGRFLTPDDESKVLISAWLSRKLQLGVGKKLVLLAQRLDGELGSASFRIAGLFDTGNSGFDRHHVLLLRSAAADLLATKDRITEVTFLLRDHEDLDAAGAALRSAIEGRPVELYTWQQRLPLIQEGIEISERFIFIYYAIFYIAMAFGIVNTLLMAIGERTHEIGVMTAIGMSRARLVGVFLLESLFIGLLAAVLGVAAGWLVVRTLGLSGIDVSAFAEAWGSLPIGRVLYPSLSARGMLGAAVTTVLVSLLVSLYPAARAARLAPVQAIGRQ